MDILQQKPHTKRPAIVQAALSLFAERGCNGTSMRDIARAAGVQEAAIYRHFASKEALAREIFLSAYIWHCTRVQGIVTGGAPLTDTLRAIVQQEFGMAERYPEAFVYVCENERKFVADLPADVSTVRTLLTEFITHGQERGELETGDPELIADMLSGALCEVALSWVRRQQGDQLRRHIDLVAQKCWSMLCR